MMICLPFISKRVIISLKIDTKNYTFSFKFTMNHYFIDLFSLTFLDSVFIKIFIFQNLKMSVNSKFQEFIQYMLHI